MEYTKVQPIRLRDIGKDEKWLQETIAEDTSILGIGDLSIIQRERPQFTGGRIDFLMYDPEDGVRYEVEVMLGTLDESHIIRSIEYWDVERLRYPALEHRAVIIAEDITNRFFNIIGLLNRAVPIIAIQLNAFVVGEKLVLNFVKVLDITETSEEEEQANQEIVDRKYWESRASGKSIEVFDKVISIVKSFSEPRITYNKHHIALGTTGRNFAWFHPRKGSHIHMEIRVDPNDRDNILKKLEDMGVECNKSIRQENLKIILTNKEFEETKSCLIEIFTKSEILSHK